MLPLLVAEHPRPPHTQRYIHTHVHLSACVYMCLYIYIYIPPAKKAEGGAVQGHITSEQIGELQSLRGVRLVMWGFPNIPIKTPSTGRASIEETGMDINYTLPPPQKTKGNCRHSDSLRRFLGSEGSVVVGRPTTLQQSPLVNPRD